MHLNHLLDVVDSDIDTEVSAPEQCPDLIGVEAIALDTAASIPATHIRFLRYRLQPVQAPAVSHPLSVQFLWRFHDRFS